jgi:DNA adenine methylase
MALPFLRWTGSKRWFTKDHLHKFLPTAFNNYHEPFLGGGATFFYLKQKSNNPSRKYFLADSNEELINCYTQLQVNPEIVIDHLKTFRNTKDDYYLIRAKLLENDGLRAARFIYLNRTSFNGIYRVNNLGSYNVPYGNRPKVDFVTEKLLHESSQLLKGVSLSNKSFENSLDEIHKNDLVFIDPPYTIAHENNGFIEYNQKLFSWEDQLKLKCYIQEIEKKGAFYIVTNAHHSSITSLYEHLGTKKKLSRESKVGGRNKTRGIFNELVIYNTTSLSNE